jgi:hypothetical protein
MVYSVILVRRSTTVVEGQLDLMSANAARRRKQLLARQEDQDDAVEARLQSLLNEADD